MSIFPNLRKPRRFLVAQIFNLLYRRIVFGWTLDLPKRFRLSDALQITNLRYSRIQFCATGLGHAPEILHHRWTEPLGERRLEASVAQVREQLRPGHFEERRAQEAVKITPGRRQFRKVTRAACVRRIVQEGFHGRCSTRHHELDVGFGQRRIVEVGRPSLGRSLEVGDKRDCAGQTRCRTGRDQSGIQAMHA